MTAPAASPRSMLVKACPYPEIDEPARIQICDEPVPCAHCLPTGRGHMPTLMKAPRSAADFRHTNKRASSGSARSNSMRAIAWKGFGKTVIPQIRTMPRPVVRSGEVLVRMIAASVQTADWRVQSLTLPRGMATVGRFFLAIGRSRHPVLGTELSGLVAMVAPDVTGLQRGDAVIAVLGSNMGAHAEYVSVSAGGAIIKKPEGLSFIKAAGASFGGLTALHFLKYRAQLKPGETVLIVGASGAVGHALVQIAKELGAVVTGTCRPENRSFILWLGVNETIDRCGSEPMRFDRRFDVIVDAYGGLVARDGLRLLNQDGRLILLTPGLFDFLWSPIHNMFSRRKLVTGTTPNSRALLCELGTLMEFGAFTPAIDTVYPMARAEAAFRHVASRSKRGSVVITS